MKNSNDSLKEKEIKQEKAMDKKELESISGGEWWRKYSIASDICLRVKCNEPRCAQYCCHGAVKYENKTWDPSSRPHYIPKFDYFVGTIDSAACTSCWFCDAQKACEHGAVLSY
jgi:hypothetical protein